MYYANDMIAYYKDEPSAVNDGYESDQFLYENNNYDLKYLSHNKIPIHMDIMINTNLKIEIVVLV